MNRPYTDHRASLSQWFRYRNLTAEELQSYAENGYLLYGPSLTQQGLEKLREECMQAWRAEKGNYDPDGSWLQNALLTNIHHRSSFVRQYYFSGPIVDVATQVIGPNIKAATSQLTFKMRGNTQTFTWHQDNSYGELDPYNAISCLTALDDADADNGCLWLIPGSHRQGQHSDPRSEEEQANRETIELPVDEASAIPLEMRAGDCLFFHCHMLHKSDGNRSADRDRRILFMRYADADAVEVYQERQPRLGRLLRGSTRFEEVQAFEADLPLL